MNRTLGIVATYGQSELGRTHPLAEMLIMLRRESGVIRLVLRGLDIAHVRTLADRGDAQTPPDGTRSLLFAKSLQWVGHSRAQGGHKRCGHADAEQCCPCGRERDRIQRADIEEKR